MEVCGVDPGLHVTGYAVLSIADGAVCVRDAGVCRTDRAASMAERLAQLATDFGEVLAQWRPQAVGVEALYAHYRHPRTAILMGHARGVLLSAAARHGVAVRDFSATQVKRFLTGNGRASKGQIQRAVRTALGLVELPEPADVADALALGLCCIESMRRDEAMVPT